MTQLTFNTAMKLLGQKNYKAVYDLAIEALREREKNPLAFFFLGIVASDHGQPEKALELFAKAAEHGPKNMRYQAHHAKALMTLGRHADAKLQADKAAALKDDDAFLLDMTGTVYSRAGYHELAVPLFRRAVKLNPNWAPFQFNLGASAQFTGDIKTAKKAYEQAVTIAPTFYRAWYALVSLETQSQDNNHLVTLEKLFSQVGRDADACLFLGHAIAKTLEDLDAYPESLDWLLKAKEVRKNQIAYDRQAVHQVFAAARETVHNQSPPKSQTTDIIPVFIVGLPRTGTTLVDRILSSHPDVKSAGEIDLFAHILERETGVKRSLTANDYESAQTADLGKVGDIYRQELCSLSENASHLIDKTPMNFFYAGLIHQALPEARIIVLRRGAMDSCLSNYRQLFALEDRRYDYAYNLEDMAAYYCEFDALMAHWNSALPGNRFMEIRYENIVSDQEPQTRRLLEFCGLDWDPACLNFHENEAAVDTASSVQVRQPLHSGAVGRWKKYGNRLDNLKSALGGLAET